MKPLLMLCFLALCTLGFSQKKDTLNSEKMFPKKVNSVSGTHVNGKRYALDSLVKLPLLNEYLVGKWEILPNEAYNYPLYVNKLEFAANRVFKPGFAKGPKAKETYYWYYSGNAIEIYTNDEPDKLRLVYTLKVYEISKK